MNVDYIDKDRRAGFPEVCLAQECRAAGRDVALNTYGILISLADNGLAGSLDPGMLQPWNALGTL